MAIASLLCKGSNKAIDSNKYVKNFDKTIKNNVV